MAITGIFTNIGLSKAQEAANNAGYHIVPTKFGVSRIADSLDPNRTTANAGLWYSAAITSREVISPNTMKFVCVIPADAFPPNTHDIIREIYLWAELNSVEFLMCIGHASIDIHYDSGFEVKFDLEVSLANTDFSELLLFKFTQAEEISAHNIDPNAHPELVEELNKAGIFIPSGGVPFEYIGQSYDIKAEFDGVKASATHNGITFTARYTGTDGNLITLEFDGIKTVDDVVLTWNNLNPKNPVYHNGIGNEVLPAQTVHLSGGSFNVSEKDLVYYDSATNFYKSAIADGTIKGKVVGVAYLVERIVRTYGYIRYAHSFPVGVELYLSDINAGKFTTSKTSVRVGLTLSSNIILLNYYQAGDDEPYPLRLYTDTPSTSKLHIMPNQIFSRDGTTRSSFPINFMFSYIADCWIDFQDKAHSGEFNIEFPISTVGKYRRLYLTEIFGGKITALFSEEVSAVSSLNDLGFLFISGNPIGWVDLECTDSSGKFKTIGSTSNVIESVVNGESRIYRIAAGAGGGGEAVEGVGLEPATGFRELIYDSFTVPVASPDSTVYSTNATYGQGVFRLLCDNTKTVTISGTNFTLSGDVLWMKAGDIIYINSIKEWVKITSISNQSSGTIDRSLSLTNEACVVSQAIFTKDFINLGSDIEKTRIRDTYGAQKLNLIHVNYSDSLLVGDNISDDMSEARIVVSASNEGAYNDTTTYPTSDKFTAFYSRPLSNEIALDYPLKNNTPNERCFLVFFPNPYNTDVLNQGSANLLDYECSLVCEIPLYRGAYKNAAFAMSDGSVPAVNSNQPVVVSGKTQWKLNFNFMHNLSSGGVSGDLEVIVDGKLIPRYVAGSTTTTYYKEISTDTIEFWADLSATPVSLIAIRREIAPVTAVGLQLAGVYDAIVGTEYQVVEGLSTHTSLQQAINDCSSNNRIALLVDIAESVTINKSIIIEAKPQTTITGNVIISATPSFIPNLHIIGDLTVDASFCDLFMNVEGNIIVNGNGNQIRGQVKEPGTVTDNGYANIINIAYYT